MLYYVYQEIPTLYVGTYTLSYTSDKFNRISPYHVTDDLMRRKNFCFKRAERHRTKWQRCKQRAREVNEEKEKNLNQTRTSG